MAFNYNPIKYLSKEEEAILKKRGRTLKQIGMHKAFLIKDNYKLKAEMEKRMPHSIAPTKNSPIEIDTKKRKRLVLPE